MKKVLFIIQSYPSERSANVFCDEKIMNELKNGKDIEIHCLTFQYNKQPLHEKVNGFEIHRFRRGLFWDIYTWARHNENSNFSKYIYLLYKFTVRIKQLIFIPIYPVFEPILVVKNYRAAKKLHEQYSFDMIVAEHLGLETLLAGYFLKRRYKGVKFIPIFWDSLSGGLLANYLPKQFAFNKRKRLEQRVISIADAAIVLSSHKENMKTNWGGHAFYKKIKYLDIPKFTPNDVEELPPSKIIDDYNRINVVFAGNLGTRKVDYIIQLFDLLKNEKILLWFFTSENYQTKIASLAEKVDVEINIRNFLSQKEYLSVLRDADFLLNFGTDNECSIPSKIFDYMSYGKPIISTKLSLNDPCTPYFEQYKCALEINDGELRGDLKKDVLVLERFIEVNNKKIVSKNILSNLFPECSPKSYVNILNQFLEN